MLNSNLPSDPHLSEAKLSFSKASRALLVSTSVSKSWLGFSAEASDSANDPIVMRPCRCRRGHSEIICLASFTSSDSSGDEVAEVRGGRPDLLSSPDVLTWRRMLRGVVLSAEMYLFKAVAALDEVTVWIA